MKVSDILKEAQASKGGNLKSGRAKYGKKMGSQTLPGYSRASKEVKVKPRPKTNLWFQNQAGWDADLRFERGDFAIWRNQRTAQEEEETLYAGNEDGTECYGYWRPHKSQGMTFFKPKPMTIVTPHRDNIERLFKGYEDWKTKK